MSWERLGVTALQLNRAGLGEPQARIADYLMSLTRDFDRLVRVTSADIAEETGTSKTMVVRFAQSLGYTGFSDLKAALLSEVHRSSQGRRFSLEQHSEWLDHIVALVEMSMAAIGNVLDGKAFRKAVALTATASSVIWFGTGDSGIIAESCYHKSLLVGLSSQLVRTVEQMQILAPRLSSEDVVVVISQSAQWASYAPPLRVARSNGAAVILVTSSRQPVIGEVADVILLTTSPDVMIDKRPFTVRAPQMVVLDALLLEASGRHPNS